MIKHFEHIFLGKHDHEYEYVLLLFLMTIFLLLSILFLIIVIYYRIVKEIDDYEDKIYTEECEFIFTSVMFDDTVSEQAELLTQRFLKHPLQQKILMRELFKLHKQFTGELADKLNKYYLDYKLIAISLKKLNSPFWNIKAEGVIELTQMEVFSALSDISKLLKYKRIPKLINVVQQSIIKLDNEKGLELLISQNEYLSDWQQLKIIDLLDKTNATIKPDFETWFDRKNISIQIFACRFIAHYRVLDAVPLLLKQLENKDNSVKASAIEAIGLLGLNNASEILINEYDNCTDEVKNKIIEALLNNVKEDAISFLTSIVKQADFQKSMNACKALNHLPNGPLILSNLLPELTLEKQTIIKHVFDKRIA